MPVSIGKGGQVEEERLLVAVQRVCDVIAKIAVVVMLAALVYLLWGIFRGHLTTAELSPQLQRNFRGASLTFSAAAVLLTLAVFVRFFEEAIFIYVMAGLGAFCFFGMPLLVTARASNDSVAARAVVGSSLGAGELIFVLAAIRVVYQLVQRARRGKVDPGEQEQTVIEETKKGKRRSLSILPSCWDLPYCHENIKQVCPQWLKRRRCWRDKHGCNCDPTMIEAMLRSGVASRGHAGAAQQRTAAGYLRQEIQDHAQRPDGRPATFEQTIPCAKCPIYNEHQRQKYRVASPLTAAAFGVGFFAAYYYGIFDAIFRFIITGASRAIAQLSFEGGGAASQPAWLAQLNTLTVEWLFIILVSLALFTYLVKLVEWAIFVKKL